MSRPLAVLVLLALGACASPTHLTNLSPIAIPSLEDIESPPIDQDPDGVKRERTYHTRNRQQDKTRDQQSKQRNNGDGRERVYQDDEGRVSVYTDERGDQRPRLILGLGFTAGPETFHLAAQGDFPIRRSLIIGPLAQIGISDDEEIYALSFNVKKEVEIEIQADGESWLFYPSAQVGVGGAFIEKDGRRGDDDDFGVMINFGLGLRVPVEDNISLGTGMLFNILPGEVLDERFFYSWQVFQMSIDF